MSSTTVHHCKGQCLDAWCVSRVDIRRARMATASLFTLKCWPVMICLLLALCGGAAAQILGLNALSAAAGSPAETKVDDLGRNTPRGTVMGFLQAARRGDAERALKYLQVSRQQRTLDSEQIVQDLQLLMDQAYVGRLNEVSDRSAPSYNSLLLPGYERAGTFVVPGRQEDLLLVCVQDEAHGPVWLISWATLSKVAGLAAEAQSHEVERHMPRILVRNSVLAIPLWVWAAFAGLIPFALFAGVLAVGAVQLPVWVLRKMQHRAAEWYTWKSIRGPVVLFATAFAHTQGMRAAHVPLLFRVYYGRFLQTVLVLAVGWLLWGLVSDWTRRTRHAMTSPRERGMLSLTLLGHRVLKAAIAIGAVLAVLGSTGVNLNAALAGLGLGGIAVALAAQKTIENLFGGVSILTDRVICVGDLCRIGDNVGIVEDIGLRSTRLRTSEHTQVSIPNGALSTMSLENLSMRQKMWINMKFGLRYETTREQLQLVLGGIRDLLRMNQRIDSETAWVGFTGLGNSALTVEVSAYVLTCDFTDFSAVREDLLLKVMKTVEDCATGFALPSQTIYLAHDTGGDKGKVAEVQGAGWKMRPDAPFPGFAQEAARSMRNAVEYSRVESAAKPPSGNDKAAAAQGKP